MYDENNKIKYYHLYSYDSHNNEIKDETYSPDDKLIRTTEYQYDKNDKTTKRIEYDGEGKITEEHDYNNVPEEIIEKLLKSSLVTHVSRRSLWDIAESELVMLEVWKREWRAAYIPAVEHQK
jgi:YD repeat-containing protein